MRVPFFAAAKRRSPVAAAQRRVLPVAGATVLSIAATAVAVAAPGARASANPLHQVLDPVTGLAMSVARPTGVTPLVPEALAHPQDDDMGTVTSGSLLRQVLATARSATANRLPGIDVSSRQGAINWATVGPHVDFVYAKATEGTYYTNPDLGQQSGGAAGRGIIHGAYHFAIPGNSGGAAQADFFVHHGGGWSAARGMLPGVLDIEYNPYGRECYGLSRSAMTTWIRDFVDEYAYDAGTFPVIYTTAAWWKACTGDTSAFAATDPLWVARYSSDPGTLPAGYLSYAFWQYSDSGRQPGDQDYFNGGYASLLALARG